MFEIKRATPNDVSKLKSIAVKTFTEAFGPFNTPENMKLYLDKSFNDERLKNELLNVNSEFYFAILDGKIIGYLKLNFGEAQTELKNNDHAVEIERIYVCKEYYGQKIAQQLFEHALDIARKKDAIFVWLGVWDANSRAIRFYEKNGFKEFARHPFMLGNELQTDLMMKLTLM